VEVFFNFTQDPEVGLQVSKYTLPIFFRLAAETSKGPDLDL